VFQQGNTVRLLANFYNWDGEPADPEELKLIIYDDKYNTISTVTETTKLDIGQYYCDYTFATAGNFIYEWLAVLGGKPTLRRRKILIDRV
jgi:hypothetical protein